MIELAMIISKWGERTTSYDVRRTFIFGLPYLVDMFEVPNSFNNSLQCNIYI